MGCVLSSIDEDGRVGICKERKKVIKQLVGIREEFSDSLLAYLRALRNTGATLRQFTESDTLELEIASNGLAEPPSPPTNLLPPPLPPFLADKNTDEIVESLEEENWEETKTDFEDEGPDSEAAVSVGKSRSGKQQLREPANDNSYALTLFRKETQTTTATPIVVGRNGKTLEGIVKELDDNFLKASACIKEIAVLIDISSGDNLLRQNSGRHNSKATYILSSLGLWKFCYDKLCFVIFCWPLPFASFLLSTETSLFHLIIKMHLLILSKLNLVISCLKCGGLATHSLIG